MGMTNIKAGGGSSSASTTSNTTSWLAGLVEPIVTNFVNTTDGIDYENSNVAGLTPAEQAALNAYGSGGAITTGQGIAKQGASLIDEAITSIQGLLHGGAKTQFMSGVTGIYNAADGFMEGQDNAIQDSVYRQMGANFGSSAQSTMASNAVSGSSNAENAKNSILASGANSMVQQESDLAEQVLRGAVGLTSGAMSGEVGLIDQLLSEGHSIFNTGAKMAESGQKNQFNAGLFEQWYNQQIDDNNRKNDMINNNMDYLNMGALLQLVLPTAGLDTTTTTKSKAGHGGFSI